MTDLVQSMEDLMRTGVGTAIFQADILQNMIAFYDLAHIRNIRDLLAYYFSTDYSSL